MDKYESLASSSGFKTMMSSPLMAAMLGGLFKKKSTETQSQSNLTSEENKETGNSDKSAKFTKIGNGPVRTLRVGDGESDILAKMYNLMQEEYSWDKKKNKKDKKYRKEFDGQKERHLEETIAALTGEQPSKLRRFGRAAKKSGITGLLAKGALGVGIFLLAEKALANVDWKSIIPNFGFDGDGDQESAGRLTFKDLTKDQQEALLTAQAKGEGAMKEGTLPNRMNNPGAILIPKGGKIPEYAKQFGAELGDSNVEGTMLKFPTMEKGRAAQRANWEKNYSDMPISDALSVWTTGKKGSKAPYEPMVTESITKSGPVPQVSNTPTGTITGKFGEKRPGHKHGGIDIKGKTGDAVVSTNDGTISQVGFEAGGYGKYIEVDHGNGLKTRYAHLSAFNVSVGDNINKGTKIGEVGNTGHSTGPHLHYELLKDGQKVDPGTALALNPVQPDYKMADADSKYAYVRQQKQIRTAEARMLGVSNRTTNIINGGPTYAYSEEPQVKDGALIQQTFYTR